LSFVRASINGLAAYTAASFGLSPPPPLSPPAGNCFADQIAPHPVLDPAKKTGNANGLWRGFDFSKAYG